MKETTATPNWDAGEKYWPVFLAEEIEDLETLKLLREADLTDMGIPLGEHQSSQSR